MAKKKKSAKRAGAKRSSAKRDRVQSPTATMYAKRKAGQFTEMDEQGRSLTTDRRQRARKRVRSGYGDQGDQERTGTASRGTASSGAKRSSKTRSRKSAAKRTTRGSRRGGGARAKSR